MFCWSFNRGDTTYDRHCTIHTDTVSKAPSFIFSLDLWCIVILSTFPLPPRMTAIQLVLQMFMIYLIWQSLQNYVYNVTVIFIHSIRQYRQTKADHASRSAHVSTSAECNNSAIVGQQTRRKVCWHHWLHSLWGLQTNLELVQLTVLNYIHFNNSANNNIIQIKGVYI